MRGKPEAFSGQPINMGCLEFFLPVTREIPIAQVVCEDINNVRFIRRKSGQVSQEKQETEMHFHRCTKK
jgi:hypothetical protein